MKIKRLIKNILKVADLSVKYNEDGTYSVWYMKHNDMLAIRRVDHVSLRVALKQLAERLGVLYE